MRWVSRTGRIWTLRPAEESRVDELASNLRLHPVSARTLAARGYDLGAVRSFLAPGAGAMLDPSTMLGLDRAVARIERALAQGEHVRLVTDYDVDGTTSCLILHAALDRRIAASGSGARVSYHIPDRFREGYGLSSIAVDTAAREGVRLLITADIGVRDHATVSRAAAAGIDVLVVDHHLPGGESVPPDAHAVLCPPQPGCGYANKALAACGVSLKLAQALLAEDPRRDEVLTSMFKLAAVGTVADVVDLSTPENRAIVTLGLAELNRGSHSPGLRALLAVAGLHPGSITTSDLGFRIGPRINAAGRLEDANAVVRLLRERDPGRALEQAAALDRLNRERQEIQNDMVDRAIASLPEPLPPFVVVAGDEADGWHRGVAGIVAAKVRDRVHRPVAVVSIIGGTAVGSVRSVPRVHAVRALDAAAALLVRYGGHPVAAGFTLPSEHLTAFAETVQRYVSDHHDDEALIAHEEVDAVLEASAPGGPLANELARFEPCGKGNPAPRLVARGGVSGLRVVKDRHLFFRVGALDAVWWGAAEHRALLDAPAGILGNLVIQHWNGRQEARFQVEDVA